jgi:D-sedoheptulose 7-phosphate isomerase
VLIADRYEHAALLGAKAPNDKRIWSRAPLDYILPSSLEHYSSQTGRRSIRLQAQLDMDYPAQYKLHVVNAIHSVDLGKVSQIIQIFKGARTHGRRIFVCGDGGSDSMASQFLCDMVKRASFNRSSRFRILAFTDDLARGAAAGENPETDRVFVEQLKNFAEPEDVVMGICTSGNSPAVVNALEYAKWIGCQTIGITGYDGGDVERLSELAIVVPVAHLGSVEDVHMIICHMIGYYFVDFEKSVGRAGG